MTFFDNANYLKLLIYYATAVKGSEVRTEIFSNCTLRQHTLLGSCELHDLNVIKFIAYSGMYVTKHYLSNKFRRKTSKIFDKCQLVTVYVYIK